MNHRHHIRVSLPPQPPGGYDVVVEPGALRELPAMLPGAAPAARYAILADANVVAPHGETLLAAMGAAGLRAELLVVPAGEAHKVRDTWAALTDEMILRGFGRDSCVIALGGGVTGDVAGFVAATYMRGVPVVQVPTSLLAMVDASIGGKTGVDTPAGKNLVGAFHQPRLVVADPLVLATLPDEELRAGLAETVKHGAIADAEYMEWIGARADALLRGDAEALARLVRRSVEIKAEFVAADVHEAGAREALNFGHTIAHALEAVTGYGLRHGYAVAIGMVAEAAIGETIGVTEAGTADAIRRVLRPLGLPERPEPGVSTEAVLAACRTDKKVRAARLRFTLLNRIGNVARNDRGGWAVVVDDATVSKVLARAFQE